MLKAVFRIRIRKDPPFFRPLDPDPDPLKNGGSGSGGQNLGNFCLIMGAVTKLCINFLLVFSSTI